MRLMRDGKLSVGFDGDCFVTRALLTQLGDKWTTLTMVRLGERPHHFGELRRALRGISQRVLTATVRNLERNGLVERTVFPTKPPQVQYALTDLGQTLLQPIAALASWAQAHHADVQRARAEFEPPAALYNVRPRRA